MTADSMIKTKEFVVVFNSDGMGSTDNQELKNKLAKTFLTLLPQMQPMPAVICFYTDGVKLACQGSPVLEELAALEAKGVRLILCQTCLNMLGIADQVKVGLVGGMGDIMTAVWQADKVITL